MTARRRFVSTGRLPSPAQVQALLDETHARFKDNNDGENAAHYPALTRVPSILFGLCIANVNGARYSAGDVDYSFTIMSIAKSFTFALVHQVVGSDAVRAYVGLNATGLPFSSLSAIEQQPNHLTNPMVNPGALATVSLAPGRTAEAKWQFILEGLSHFAGRPLSINQEVYTSASASNHRNRAIVQTLRDYERLDFDPMETLDVYTRQSCIEVTAGDLAMMGATLADGGINPITKKQVVDEDNCQHTLAIMATAGMYEASGDWLYDVGLPGKSGVGGGILTVAPGKGALATFSPRLDAAGNSVRGQLATRFLSEKLGLNLFASEPA